MFTVYPELVNLTEIAIEPIIDPIPDMNITLPVIELEMFPQIPTSADCSNERVEAVIVNVLERLRLAAPFAWLSLVHHSYVIGVDLGEDAGIHQLACYVASMELESRSNYTVLCLPWPTTLARVVFSGNPSQISFHRLTFFIFILFIPHLYSALISNK